NPGRGLCRQRALLAKGFRAAAILDKGEGRSIISFHAILLTSQASMDRSGQTPTLEVRQLLSEEARGLDLRLLAGAAGLTNAVRSVHGPPRRPDRRVRSRGAAPGR